MSIAENIARVREEMAAAAREAGRAPEEITLVGASKMNDAAACREAIAAGIDALGENRVQEMTQKLSENAYDGAPVHFIGQNSNRFYRVANLCKKLKLKLNMAMFMLPDEMFRARGSSYTIVFGKPIPVESFDSSRTRLEWAAEVRKQVYEL